MLENKVAIITGAGSGIGRASALAFAREGAKVVLADWVEEGGVETVSMVRDTGGDAVFVKADVSQTADVKRMVDAALDKYGRLDCAYNNAGIGCGPTLLCDYDDDVWQKTVDVNLKGVYLCLKYEIPAMLATGGGAIANTASAAGLVALAYVAPYVAAKHGVVGLTKAAALDYATSGIRVNAICPGTIRTPLVQGWLDLHPEDEEAWTKVAPMERMAEPMEVAELAVWLCSDKSSFVTGQAIAVDGGAVAR
jgi:NAD(P)-dependent dehydrogenase (short-subunit alcohol dehydrogenase family)